MSLRNVLRIGMRLSSRCLEKRCVMMSPSNTINDNRWRLFSSTKQIPDLNSKVSNDDESRRDSDEKKNSKTALGKLEGKLRLFFTCKRCNTRNSKIISKIGYETGVVIVRCDGCKNNHLIADNLGWFPELKDTRNIELLLASKGEKVRRIMNYEEGYFEAVVEEELAKMKKQNEKIELEVDGEEENLHKVEYEKVGTPIKT